MTNKPSSYDHSTHHLLSIKNVSDVFIEFRRELTHHQDIMVEIAKPQWKTFEMCIGRIAQMLGIVMDGEYEPDGMFVMLTTALKNRHKYAELNPHMLAPGHGLKAVEIEEREDTIKLVEVARDMGFTGKDESNSGPYTVCNDCVTSFDCITSRGCKRGKPAMQLENAIKELRRSIVH